MSWDGKVCDKYRVEHTDGTPLKGKKYFVLRLDSDDPVEAARVAAAMRAYKGEPRNCDVGTTKPLSLDEAIAHADEVAGSCGTACEREHKQLADWLRELKARRSAEQGDYAKLREALVKIEKMAHCDLCNVYPKYRDKFNDMIGGIEREARAALAAPSRNCDVGTPREQADRAFAFCLGRRCEDCEFAKLTFRECTLAWAQLPCGKGGAK